MEAWGGGLKEGVWREGGGRLGGIGGLIERERGGVVVIVAFSFAGRRWKVLEVCKPFNPSF